MFVTLVFRNLGRNLNRNYPILCILFFSFALLTLSSFVIRSVSHNYYKMYTEFITADFSILNSQQSNTTIFGNTTLLVGNFIQTEIIQHTKYVADILRHTEMVKNWTGVLTLPIQVKAEENTHNYIAFGVDFSSYLEVFSNLILYRGDFPKDTGSLPQIMIQKHHYETLGAPPIGSKLLLTASNGYGFAIREVELGAVYGYPINDSLSSEIVLVDAGVIRSLAGHITVSTTTIPDDTKELFLLNIDDLFESTTSLLESGEKEEGLEIQDIENILLRESSSSFSHNSSIMQGWHFILVDVAPEYSINRVMKKIQKAGINNSHGYTLFNWRNTAGNNAQILFLLFIIIVVSFIIISCTILLIIINSMLLFIFERYKEIGTMRVLGANKLFIAKMLSSEVLIMVLGTGILGIMGGVMLLFLVNNAHIMLSNQYLITLFNGERLRGDISFSILLELVLCVMLFTIICISCSLIKGLRILPIHAIK